MSQYWLIDSKERVLGPVSLPVIRDLATCGRLPAIARISRDGRTFLPVSDLPELADVFYPQGAQERLEREQHQAEVVRADFKRFQTLATHELFGVAEHAPWNDYRKGFLEIARRYHPARLPRGVHPDLLNACVQIFTFLLEKMKAAEKSQDPAEPPPARRLATPAPPPAPKPAAPVGVTLNVVRSGPMNRLEGTLDIPDGHTEAFNGHRLVNLSAGCIFVPMREVLPLGTRIELTLRFLGRGKELKARGVVVLECSAASEKQPQGVGIRLESLTPDDRAFLQMVAARGVGGAPASRRA